MRRQRTSIISLLLLFLIIAFTGCRQEEELKAISLPPTPVLTVKASWGVVNSPYLRMREEPRLNARVKAPLHQHTLVEIISKTPDAEVIEDQKNYWFQVNYDGLKGWVFGAYLDLFDSREKAEQQAGEQK